MLGVKDPRSRRFLKRPVRFLTKKGLTNTYRSSSRWHTRAWAHAVLRGVESDGVIRYEAYPAEDVEMAVAVTVLSDDEFHEEPQLEEQRVLEEVPKSLACTVGRYVH